VNYFKVFMDIDEQLINQNTESTEAELAGQFRASKRGEMQERGEDERASLRERIQQKRAEETKKFKEDYKGGEESNIQLNPVLETTDELLKFAWENLIASFGLTLLWIDIHVFLNKVFGPNVFRDVGEEWLPESIKKLGNEKSKSAASLLKISEGVGIGCLNLGCLFLIIFLLTIASIIGSILSGDLSFIWAVVKEFAMGLYNLFQ
jgi:hypothetical protein